MATDDLVRLLEVYINQWLQENFGETFDRVIENGQGTMKHKAKRTIVLTCLYMLDVDQFTIAKLMNVVPGTIKTWYKNRDLTTTAAALDMYSYVADKVSSFFEEQLLDAKAAHSRLRAVAHDHNLSFINSSVTQFNNTADEIYGYYVKRLRNATDSFGQPVKVKHPIRIAHVNQ